MLFDLDFLSPSYFLIRHMCGDALHMVRLVCIAREFFFFSWKSACDQHRANQHCPDRGQGFC
ncbi:unnamed protein product, partial [Staurois parvus]